MDRAVCFFSVGGEFGWSAKKTTSYLQTLTPANQRTSDAADHRALLKPPDGCAGLSTTPGPERGVERVRASEGEREREKSGYSDHMRTSGGRGRPGSVVERGADTRRNCGVKLVEVVVRDLQ